MKAIKQSSNSIAAGPDRLTMLHLKHPDPRSYEFLTHLFNLSLYSADITSIWMRATLIPIPKTGKLRHLTSYRLISLLCPSIKFRERLLLPALEVSPRFTSSQHRFCKVRSNTSALLPITLKVVAGFNKNKPPLPTIAMAIDISKSFETVNHTKLIEAISVTGLHNNIIRWLTAYLWGRTASCRYKNTTDLPYSTGSVISPLLLNFFVSNC